MPAKMSRHIPLPMPRSVICSPSHMMKAVPAVRVMTQRGMKAPREMVTMVWPVLVLVSVSAIAKDCTMPSRTVT